ncbi:MAG: MaoC family dehydratase [Desulfobacterales bacterium]|jgi:3-hydroxybutyryl-CoA dehydratase|nr:MaoC family dehydratase [Desulfobacterales bacterium]
MKDENETVHAKPYTLAQLRVGQTYKKSWAITAELIEGFARVTGDYNPIHLDEDYARQTVFEKRVAQGMLGAGLLSGVMGCEFPGTGTIYLSQTLKFLKPVFVEDEITLRLEVLEIIDEKNRVRLETAFTNQEGEAVITGEALVMLPAQ